MDIASLAIEDVKIVRLRRAGDLRGFFSETYNQRTLLAAGIDAVFVQDNHSQSAPAGVLRGLHFQIPPRAQAKLLHVVRGRIYDVVVDIRRGSPTFGQHVGVEISAQAWNQIYVPIGFAHGFVTLEPDTAVIYKVSDFYSPEHERGIAWNDPALAIRWPLPAAEPTLSDRDRQLPRLTELPAYFFHTDSKREEKQ